ncbi:MAG: 23S rRNA (guanosine(2251)-2'-O)-methyltransferase RlmB [Gammaproteobacteria bacterium]|nr:23S rRNA (guanosine(2251)-2'-O)-methyltransferase RlmB [Gammaproteobacteria bacterium]
MSTVVGIHAVQLALEARAGICLAVREGKLNARQQSLVELARSVGCRIEFGQVDRGELASQGVSLEIRPPAVRSEKELEAQLAGDSASLLFLVLDGVTDPRNFGACLRSAASFGVDGVIVARDHSAPLNEAAIKTASGAASLVRIYQVVNLARCLDTLKKHGVWVVGTVLEDSQPLTEIDLKGNIALVVGAEESGIRQKTRERCDFLAAIPCPFPDLSLNVSVAAGICLYEINRQR